MAAFAGDWAKKGAGKRVKMSLDAIGVSCAGNGVNLQQHFSFRSSCNHASLVLD
jgi:hypothetical protein